MTVPEESHAEEEFSLENLDGEEAPAAAPVVPEPESPKGPDYAALEAKAAEVRPGTTLQNIVDQFAEQHSTLSRTTTKLNALEKEYGFGKPLLDQIRKDPKYADAIRQTTDDYFSDDEKDADPSIANVLDPVTQRLDRIERENAERRMLQDMDVLSQKYPQYVDDNVKQRIWGNVAETGNTDLEGIFGRIMLPTLVERAAAATKQAERIQKNAGSYTPTDGTATAPNVGKTTFTADDIEAGIEEIMRTGST